MDSWTIILIGIVIVAAVMLYGTFRWSNARKLASRQELAASDRAVRENFNKAEPNPEEPPVQRTAPQAAEPSAPPAVDWRPAPGAPLGHQPDGVAPIPVPPDSEPDQRSDPAARSPRDQVRRKR